jgi:hypothetical protein
MNHPFKFKVNDIVRLKTGDSHLYCIKGFHVEYNGSFPGEEWIYIVYELVRPFDGLNVEAEEEDLILISRPAKESPIKYAKLIIAPVLISEMNTNIKNDVLPTVDELLDKFNDLKALYSYFGDTKYLVELENIKDQLNHLSK